MSAPEIPGLEADPPRPQQEFVIGVGGSSDPLHAVHASRLRALREWSPTLCGIKSTIARKLGPFERGNPRVAANELCPHCAWHVALANGTTEQEITALRPGPAAVEALGTVMPDPQLFVRVVRRLLDLGRDNDTEVEPWAEMLAYVTAHRPVLLTQEDCVEDACEHENQRDCYGENPTVACAECSFRAGESAGEWEGHFLITVAGPCAPLLAAASHYKVEAVTS